MRVDVLRLCNLNSLAGTWEIDFRNPEYLQNGLFCIVGPTGSGKTTLLDALCLALYGKTPRLDSVSKSTNEIMSRGTGFCFAEVDFSTHQGRFRSRWYQHRARKSPDGDLQPPQHELSDPETGVILQEKIRDVAQAVEAATGMDYQRFSRSMLLAQGRFAEFLNSGADERAPILEQITGTELYGDLSQRAFERAKEERQKREVLEAALGDIKILGAEERDQLQETIKNDTEESERHRRALKSLQDQIQKLKRRGPLEEDIKELLAQEEQQKFRGVEFLPLRARLLRGEKARAFESEYLILTDLRNRAARLKEELVQQNARGPALAEAQEQSQARHLSAQKHHEDALREWETRLPLWDKALLVDQNLTDLAQRLKLGREEAEGQSKALALWEAEGRELEKQRGESQRQLESSQNWLSLHPQYGILVQEGTLLSEKVRDLEGLHTQVLKNHQDLLAWSKKTEGLKKDLDAAGESQQSHGAERDKVSKRLEELSPGQDLAPLENQLKALREGWDGALRQREFLKLRELFETRSGVLHTLIQSLEAKRSMRELYARIQGLEEERRKLVPGEPCPLCGAANHPYGDHSPLKADDLEKIQALKDSLETLESQERVLDREVVGLQAQLELKSVNLPPHLSALTLVEIENLEKKFEQDFRLKEESLKEFLSLQAAKKRLEAEHQALESARQKREWEYRLGVQKEENLKEDLKAQKKNLERVQKFLLEKLLPLGYKDQDLSSPQKLLEDLSRRLSEFEKQTTLLQRAQTALEIGEHKATQNVKNLEGEKLRAETLGRQLQGWENQSLELKKELYALVGEEDPQTLKSRGKKSLLDLELKREDCQKEFQERKSSWLLWKQAQEGKTKDLEEMEAQCREGGRSFGQKILAAGFGDEADFARALLSHQERRDLEQKRDELDKNTQALQAALEDRRSQLAHLSAQFPEGYPLLADLETLERGLESQLTEIWERLGGHKTRWLQNEENSQNQSRQAQEWDRQKREEERWSLLSALIGSSDGKKFRVFAQGLTFERLIVQANAQLVKMTDRYLLVPQAEKPLELDILDNYQGSERRSTRNLSGGESFLVSLALALGLSQMSSRRVRVDSLFLDEGFGTLDVDTLETALDTLDGLHQDGKMIGVISHVEAMKERIGTQIQVLTGSGGVSTLKGPGIRRLP